ncbi:hypothetical protein [Capnocytophaga leadbetteri]|uniref:hypothetical protein n=1 Tax=Capnocytophaga leadbetteri TaxID=327575 RepID=UPI0028E5FA5F|nr:hypothetical protein [Capnocytophaga leadbetteri]
MDIYNVILDRKNIENVIDLIKENKKIIPILYSYEDIFSETLDFLLINKNRNTDLEYIFNMFIDILIGQLITKPSDLLICIKHIKDRKDQILFLKMVMHSRLVNDDVLIALGQNKYIFQQLPYDLSWVEIPIVKYGSKIILSAKEKLSIIKICPLMDYINDNSLLEFLLAWALEENKLDNPSIDYFKYNHMKKYVEIMG